MNNYATPETFKPGERWLATDYSHLTLRGPFYEVECLEWSPSGKFVKVQYQGKTTEWLAGAPYLLERLPDESSVNQAAAVAGTVEGDSAKSCKREDCRAIRQELTQRIIREAAQEASEGKTFTVATSQEIAANNKSN